MEKKRGMNKKGAEMTIGTIIIIILALVVLVVIIYGFTTGWSNLWQKITGLGGGKADVQTHVQACQIACSMSAKNDYCKVRNITFTDTTKPQSSSCSALAADPKYGLDACTSVNCIDNNNNAAEGTCEYWGGAWQATQCDPLKQETVTGVTNAVGYDGQFCCKITCARLNGQWQANACDSATFTNKYEEVTDKEDGNMFGYTNCCVAK